MAEQALSARVKIYHTKQDPWIKQCGGGPRVEEENWRGRCGHPEYSRTMTPQVR